MMKGKWMISNGCYIGHDITGNVYMYVVMF